MVAVTVGSSVMRVDGSVVLVTGAGVVVRGDGVGVGVAAETKDNAELPTGAGVFFASDEVAGLSGLETVVCATTGASVTRAGLDTTGSAA